MFNCQVSKFAEDVFGNNFCDISALRGVKNLGALDCNMSMEEQIKSTVKKWHFQNRNVGIIRHYIIMKQVVKCW